MTPKIFRSLTAVVILLGSFPAHSQTVPSIQLDATLQVQDGCNINGGEKNPEALLNFGIISNVEGITTPIDGSTTVADGGISFSVICNVTIDQVFVAISGGTNDLDGVRRLAHESIADQFVPYHIYVDEGRTIEYTIDTPVPLFDFGSVIGNRISSQFVVDFYGRIFPPLNAVAGTYRDHLMVNLTF